MNIEFGSIEYFSLLSFHDKLMPSQYDSLDLVYLDKLRLEIEIKIAAINLQHEQKKNKG